MTQITPFVPYGHITSGSELQKANKIKLEGLIHAGFGKVEKTIQHVQDNLPGDIIAPVSGIGFAHHEGKIIMSAGDGKAFSLHPHAVGQIADEINVPNAFFSRYMSATDPDPWGAKMCADVLQQTWEHVERFTPTRRKERRFLVRHVAKEARGFLSDSYKRFDSGLLLDSFTSTAKKLGVMPYEGLANDTRWYIRALLDRLIEVRPNEFYAYGTCLGHSDFGDGAMDLRFFFLRLACTNGAMAEQALRAVHLGKKLQEDITWSEKTYRLDSEMKASQIHDAMTSMFDGDAIAGRAAIIGQSYDEKIEVKQVEAGAQKLLGSKDLAKQIVDAFTSADVEMMPAGNTKARWAQAAAWVAQKDDMTVENRVKLEKYAAQQMGFTKAMAADA